MRSETAIHFRDNGLVYRDHAFVHDLVLIQEADLGLLEANFEDFLRYLKAQGLGLRMPTDIRLGHHHSIPLLMTIRSLELMTEFLVRGADPFFPVVAGKPETVIQVILKQEDLNQRNVCMRILFTEMKRRCLEELNCQAQVAHYYREREAILQLKNSLDAQIDLLNDGMMQEENQSWFRLCFLNTFVSDAYNSRMPFLYLCYYTKLHDLIATSDGKFDYQLTGMKWTEWVFPSRIYRAIAPALKQLEATRAEIKQTEKELLKCEAVVNIQLESSRKDAVISQKEEALTRMGGDLTKMSSDLTKMSDILAERNNRIALLELQLAEKCKKKGQSPGSSPSSLFWQASSPASPSIAVETSTSTMDKFNIGL